MLLSSSKSNFNIIEPLPRFFTIRFGRRMEIDDNYENNSRHLKHTKVKKNYCLMLRYTVSDISPCAYE